MGRLRGRTFADRHPANTHPHQRRSQHNGRPRPLETALRELRTETRVAVLHYSPIRETLVGEPEEIFPFLGSSRLLPPIETYRADVVFHGHAHIGSAEARTPGGVPVYNVAVSVLQKATGKSYRIWKTKAPERRRVRTV